MCGPETAAKYWPPWEAARAARLDGHVGDLPYVVHEDIVQAQSIGEADECNVARWVHRSRERLLRKVLDLLARLGGIVPHTHGAVDAAGEQQRLLGADVDAGDCLVVEAARKVG